MYLNSNLIFSSLIYFGFQIILTTSVLHQSDRRLRLIQNNLPHGIEFTTVDNYGNWICRGAFKDSVQDKGYSIYELETNPEVIDDLQAYGGGHTEGSLATDFVHAQWFNTVKDFCDKNKTRCEVIDKFIDDNFKWVKRNVEKNLNSSYWHQVKLYYMQMEGIRDGYNDALDRGNPNHYPKLTMHDIIKINIYPEIMDIVEAKGDEHVTGSGSCSVLIKILPGNRDIYFGHSTWADYRSMLRVKKNVILKYSLYPDSVELIPGIQSVYTSYPGSVSSTDDFYLMSTGLAITETSIEVFNKTLWKYVSPENMIWECIRSVVANRLATDGKSWSKIFQKYNSGTYNNQWMILDYKKFKPGKPLKPNAFWVIEQAPSKIIAKDLTNVLVKNTYWSSYNIPYYNEIYSLLDYKSMADKYGDWFVHDEAPRAKIFKRDHVNVFDMNSFMQLMRSNDYKHDPFAQCKCDPPYTATGAIAARDDLNLINGSYPFKGISNRPAGAIDAKITNSDMFFKLQFTAIYGPTKGTGDKLPPFQWSKSNFNGLPHLMQPDKWDFAPVTHKWSKLYK